MQVDLGIPVANHLKKIKKGKVRRPKKFGTQKTIGLVKEKKGSEKPFMIHWEWKHYLVSWQPVPKVSKNLF